MSDGEIAEMVRSLRELTSAKFFSVQQQLDALTALPVLLSQLRGDIETLKHRVEEIESDARSGAEWRRVHLPALVISILTLLVSLALVLTGALK